MHNLTHSTLLALGLCGAIALATTGCAESSSGTSSSTTGSAKAETSAKAAATAEPAVKLVDHALDKADATWAGWTAQAPESAKVMVDGVKGARLAADGPSILDRKPGGDEGFDIAFAWGKEDLKEHKKNVESGTGAAKSTLTVLKDEPGALEYTLASDTAPKSYHFMIHMKVDGKDVTCRNGNMMGAGNEAEHKRLMEACKTLAKK